MVDTNMIDCIVPPEMEGRTGRVEIQLALDGSHFARPGRLGSNLQRPKYHYYFYRMRLFERSPAGGACDPSLPRAILCPAPPGRPRPDSTRSHPTYQAHCVVERR